MHLSRRIFMKLLGMSILTLGLWIQACNFGNAGPEPPSTPEEETNMENLKISSKPKTTIPPIDTALPARIETATFALG